MVDLFALGDPPPGLDEDGPVGEFLPSVNCEHAVASQVQAVFPNHAAPEKTEGRVHLHRDSEAVGRGDRPFSPASAGPRISGLNITAVPPLDDGVPL